MPYSIVYTATFKAPGSRVIIPYSFSGNLIIVEASTPSKPSSWNMAGVFYPILDLSGIGKVSRQRAYVYFEKQTLEFPSLSKLRFTGEFYIRYWIPSLTLTFWE